MRVVPWIVERVVMFGDWGEGIVVEGVARCVGRDRKVELKAKPWVEVGSIAGG